MPLVLPSLAALPCHGHDGTHMGMSPWVGRHSGCPGRGGWLFTGGRITPLSSPAALPGAQGSGTLTYPFTGCSCSPCSSAKVQTFVRITWMLLTRCKNRRRDVWGWSGAVPAPGRASAVGAPSPAWVGVLAVEPPLSALVFRVSPAHQFCLLWRF